MYKCVFCLCYLPQMNKSRLFFLPDKMVVYITWGSGTRAAFFLVALKMVHLYRIWQAYTKFAMHLQPSLSGQTLVLQSYTRIKDQYDTKGHHMYWCGCTKARTCLFVWLFTRVWRCRDTWQVIADTCGANIHTCMAFFHESQHLPDI